MTTKNSFLTTATVKKTARYFTARLSLKYLIVSLQQFSIDIESNTSLEHLLRLIFLALFFLFSTVGRIEEINRYLGSVNLNSIDIEISEFGEKFHPSKLNYNSSDKENTRKSV